MKSEITLGFVKAFDHYRHKFNSTYIISSPVKLLKNSNLKFKPNLVMALMINQDYLYCVIVIALYNLKI